MKKCFTQSFILTSVTTLILFFCLQLGFAQVRSSSNYQLQSDSINIGGGFSSSTSYIQESTVGEVATGISDSSSYSLRAGYQQMQEVYISMTTPTDVNLSPDLAGLTGGTSNGSTTVTVTTDSPSGYSLTIASEDTPAMNNGAYSITDYNEGADPDFSFVVTGGQASFGFSPSSVDLVDAFRDNGGGNLCNAGSSDTLLACWAGLSTTDTLISEGIGSNHPDGATTTLYFRVGVGSGAGVIAGLYTATTTLTALPL
jgi:hypothetical protein